MPAIVIHESEQNPIKRNLKLRQLSSSFSMQPDGLIEVPLQFLIPPNGLTADNIKSLLPKAGNKLDASLYSVRNIPENRGLFVRSSEIEYKEGLHFAKIVCVSCAKKPQAVVTCDYSTTTFSLEIEGVIRDGKSVPSHTSFQAKTPTINIHYCCLIGEEQQNIGISVEISTADKVKAEYSYINVIAPFGEYSRGFQFKWIPYNITNKKAFSANESYFDLLESQSSTTDGSVVQLVKQHSVQLVTNED